MIWVIVVLLVGSVVVGIIWGTRSQKPSPDYVSSGGGMVVAEVAFEVASVVAEVAIDVLSDS